MGQNKYIKCEREIEQWRKIQDLKYLNLVYRNNKNNNKN